MRGGSSGINVNHPSCVSFHRPLPEEVSQPPNMEGGHYETIPNLPENQNPRTSAPVARDYETPQPYAIHTLKHEDAGEY